MKSRGLIKFVKGRWRKTQQGIAALEAAITFPLLFLLFFGIFEYSMVLFVRHNMLHAAREGARVVAMQDGTTTDAIATATSRLTDIQIDFTVQAFEDTPSVGEVQLQITAPFVNRCPSDGGACKLGIVPVDPYLFFDPTEDLRVRVTMLKEGG